MSLHLGPGLILPENTVTAKIVIFGSSGMGKSSTGAVISEELHSQGQRFTYIDPTGAMYGLRYSADGDGPGLAVPIFGGERGDIPIDPGSGRAVANLIVGESASAILDLSRYANGRMWKTIDQVIFVRDFCEELYLRQGEKRKPMMLIIDEATRFAPGAVRRPEDGGDAKNPYAACKERIEEILQQARILGIGCTLITLRDAQLAKSVSEIADCGFFFRTVGPRSVSAVMEWIKDNVDDRERLTAIRKELRSLPRGSAMVVSPGWLEMDGTFRIRPRATFDSSSTPAAGKERVVNGEGAIVERLQEMRERMTGDAERMRENDPERVIARLQAENAALERRVRDLTRYRDEGISMGTRERITKVRIEAAHQNPAQNRNSHAVSKRLIARAVGSLFA